MVRIITETDLRNCVTLDDAALATVEDGFRRLARGEVSIPPILGLEMPDRNGAMDVKTAYVAGWDSFAVKLSTRFFDNPIIGLPSGSGLMTLMDSTTGRPRAVLLDNGYLTTVRTALAGALAAKYLSPAIVDTVAVIGAGSQAEWQVRALTLVRSFRRVVIWARSGDHAGDLAKRLSRALALDADVAVSASDAVAQADTVVTTTPSPEPLLTADMLHPGLHVTAMGADAPHKNEIDPALLAAVDVLACDLESQCVVRGEMHHGVTAGVILAEGAARELGYIINGTAAGRERDDQTTFCDLTGVGVQDTAIARQAYQRAVTMNLGMDFDDAR